MDVQLNCSASGSFAYLTAGLVYSASDGGVTASTLTNMLRIWLVSEDNPSLLVDGTPVALSKQCITQITDVARNGCIELFTSDAETKNSPNSTPHTVAGFFSGLVAGILLTVLVVALIAW